eukprot:TRINITY_DN441_c0_g1_i1.p1 TRINITY_DN441_c0_g1~~TRINITY_DN441_c0_g1_i1.p1  ORF type:complete len:272 (-),score=76.54 TRINITY_DN441_c0_g1_i1:665-1453(-)
MSSLDDQLESALDLMRRLPPSEVSENLGGILDLVPDLTEDLLAAVDQPLEVAVDSSGRDYLLCDYNRDADSFRSPWTNEYDPPLDDGAVPSDDVRKLEIVLNDAFNAYRELYYDGGISSVYLWDTDEGFAGCILIKKSSGQGHWDSLHVVEVTDNGSSADYRLTSSVMLFLKGNDDKINLSGNLTRLTTQDGQAVNEKTPHVFNIGKLVEDMEHKLRNTIQTVYFGRTMDIVSDMRPQSGTTEIKRRKDLSEGIHQGVGGSG